MVSPPARNQAASPFGGAEFATGATLTGEQAVSFGDVLSHRITELSRQGTLSTAESEFVAWSADLCAGNIIAGVRRFGMTMPGESIASLKSHADSFAENARFKPLEVSPPRNEAEVRQDALSSIERLTGGVAARKLRASPELRTSLEDFGAEAVVMFGAMVVNKGGIVLDNDMAGNLQYMLGLYDMIEKAGPTAE